MITMGVDQSYTSSGFCIVDGNSNHVTDFGTFTTSKELDVYDRANLVADFIIDKAVACGVGHISIEGLAFGIRGDATRDLAGLLFTIVGNVRRRAPHIGLTIIAPTSLKKFATGTGKSDKAAMIAAVPQTTLDRFVEAKYKKTTGLADIVDAYWLAHFKN